MQIGLVWERKFATVLRLGTTSSGKGEQSKIVPQRKADMVNFSLFGERCKMRHDFDDQIQVRYRHGEGEEFDTWVSGLEALQRLRSEAAEERLKGLSQLAGDDLKLVLDSLPEITKGSARESLRDALADRLQNSFGGNIIGDALSDSARGRSTAPESANAKKQRWLALLKYEPFRQRVLHLAWIQLEGSFPKSEPNAEPDDWH